MLKTFYIKVNQETKIIEDIISYPYGNYIQVELETPLPIGINGGWFKYEKGKVVEYLELKPEETEKIDRPKN